MDFESRLPQSTSASGDIEQDRSARLQSFKSSFVFKNATLQSFVLLQAKDRESMETESLNAFIQLTDVDENSIKWDGDDVHLVQKKKRGLPKKLVVYPTIDKSRKFLVYELSGATLSIPNRQAVMSAGPLEREVFLTIEIRSVRRLKIAEKSLEWNGDKCGMGNVDVDDENVCVVFQTLPKHSQWVYALKSLIQGPNANLMGISSKHQTSLKKKPKGCLRSLAPVQASRNTIETGSKPEEKTTKAEWMKKKWAEWDGGEVVSWLKIVKFDGSLSLYDVCKEEGFSTCVVTGATLKTLRTIDDVRKKWKHVDEIKVQATLISEVKNLRARDYYTYEMGPVIDKYIAMCEKVQKEPELRRFKRDSRFSFDVHDLMDLLICILFDVPEKEAKDPRAFLDKLIERDDIGFFQFMCKVVAIMLKERHVRVIPASSKRAICLYDVDCFCVPKPQIYEWLRKLASIIIDWNAHKRYIRLNLDGNQQKMNCQDFVKCVLRDMGSDFYGGTPSTVLTFFDQMRKVGVKQITKRFFFTAEFRETCALDDNLDPELKKQIGLPAKKIKGESSSKMMKKKGDPYVTFHTHSQLDRFVHALRFKKWSLCFEFCEEYELLKSFDRAFHISREYYELRQNADEKHKQMFQACCCDSELGCPFNNRIALLLDTVDLRDHDLSENDPTFREKKEVKKKPKKKRRKFLGIF